MPMILGRFLVDGRGWSNSEATGCEGFGNAITLYATSRSEMFAAIGPMTVTVLGTSPILWWEGFRPYTPQNEDGILILPPPSVPRAIGRTPADTAYADPLDEPPV